VVYDVLLSSTATVDFAIGLEKLSANEQFFDDAQTAVSLEQTSPVTSGVYLFYFITNSIAYARTNKTKIF